MVDGGESATHRSGHRVVRASHVNRDACAPQIWVQCSTARALAPFSKLSPRLCRPPHASLFSSSRIALPLPPHFLPSSSLPLLSPCSHLFFSFPSSFLSVYSNSTFFSAFGFFSINCVFISVKCLPFTVYFLSPLKRFLKCILFFIYLKMECDSIKNRQFKFKSIQVQVTNKLLIIDKRNNTLLLTQHFLFQTVVDYRYYSLSVSVCFFSFWVQLESFIQSFSFRSSKAHYFFCRLFSWRFSGN